MNRCVKCGKNTPLSGAGAVNPSGRMCLPCWDSLSDIEAIAFGSMGVHPVRPSECRHVMGRGTTHYYCGEKPDHRVHGPRGHPFESHTETVQ